ncbi:uncharacterized protein LOC142339993 [Convolutriloba macropyga]|uniref:uncharacterized protein LOC142339993 n=1 Tax=Convolutriloba macropyga TaxID=536237 RepID=UPI003F528DA3
MTGESRLHLLNKLSGVINYDSLLNNEFPGCLNRETGLYMKAYVDGTSTARKSQLFLNHLISRIILPPMCGGLSKQVQLFQLGNIFHRERLSAVMICQIRLFSFGESMSNSEMEMYIERALKRLSVVHCISFQEKLEALEAFVESMSKLTVNNVNHISVFSGFSCLHQDEKLKWPTYKSLQLDYEPKQNRLCRLLQQLRLYRIPIVLTDTFLKGDPDGVKSGWWSYCKQFFLHFPLNNLHITSADPKGVFFELKYEGACSGTIVSRNDIGGRKRLGQEQLSQIIGKDKVAIIRTATIGQNLELSLKKGVI